MTVEDNEFPPLTQQAKCVLMNTMNGIDVSRPYWDRRFAAAVIREAMVQSGLVNVALTLPDSNYWHVSEDFPAVIRASELSAIADNLHALPPEPPLKKQALDIWAQVEGEVSDAQARIMRNALTLIPDPTP